MSDALVSQKEVICKIGNEEYGISVTDVVSIERVGEVTKSPSSNNPVLFAKLENRMIVLLDIPTLLIDVVEEIRIDQ